jgi:hypothetical protein
MHGPSGRPTASPQEMRALQIAIVLMFTLAAAMGWLVTRGVTQGETFTPMKRSSLRRVVSRVDEPTMFWVATGIYATIGIGALGLGVWGIREGRKLDTRRG